MEYVRLKERDLELLISTCQMVVDYKFKSLANHNWKLFESKYLPSLLQALKDNKFKVASTQDSILVWIIDQIIHSRRVVEGIPKKDWIPLADIDSVQECLSFLRAARLGQQSYDLHHSTPHYHNLFR